MHDTANLLYNTMKKIIISILTATMFTSASAVTWWHNGVLFGNVCRNGVYFTVYPERSGQPVGSTCPVRDSFGNILGYGLVTAE